MGTLCLSADTDPAQAAAALIQSKDAQAQLHGLNGISEAVVIDNAWTPSNGGKISTNCALVMENVADGYKKPNILDVKLGARLWADDAPPAKRAKLDKVAEETTSKALGFRVAGMRVWHGLNAVDQQGVNLDGYKFYDKDYGRKLTPENVVEGFEDYFRVARGTRPLGPTRELIERFIDNLKDMRKILEKEESRMYSASLLFVYEGDPAALQEARSLENHVLDSMEAEMKSLPDGDGLIDYQKDRLSRTATPCRTDTTGTPLNGDTGKSSPHPHTASQTSPDDGDPTVDEEGLIPHIQALKLIDFAHAAWTPGQGRDDNLLHGIRNVIKALKELLA